MLIVCLMPSAALADSVEADAADVIAAFGDTVLTYDGKSVSAGEQDGRAAFVFEGIADNTMYVFADEAETYYDEDNGEYDLYVGDVYINVALNEGSVYGLYVANLYVDEDNYYDGQYTDPSIEPNGSDLYPWPIGATAGDTVCASYYDGMLYIMGEGSMMDFENTADRPWDLVAADISMIFVSDSVQNIGKNAFRGCGPEVCDEYNCVSLFVSSDSFTEIGESAFEGIGLIDRMDMPETLTKIDSRAFADTKLVEITFYGPECEIADDAFAGTEAKAFDTSKNSWSEEARLDYGGSITWSRVFFLTINLFVDGEEYGNVVYYMHDFEEFDIDISEEIYDCEFVGLEVVSGDFTVNDPTDSIISGVISSDIVLNASFKNTEGGDEGDVIDDEGDDDDEPEERIVDPVINPTPVPKDDETEVSKTTSTPDTADYTNELLYVCIALGAALVFGLSFIPDTKKN